MIHHDQGNYAEAVKLYEDSLAIARSLGDQSGIAISLGQLGRLKEEQKDLKGALDSYLSALIIFEKLHDPNREIAMKDIARLRAAMGEDAFQKALSRRRGSA
jgi:tetratricopeptide (TPR) repeat protein